MNKKGFTMIELLAVIIILAVLLGVTTVSVFSIRKNQEEENYENTISSILTGVKAFTAEHPNRKNPGTTISVQELIDGEYIDFDKEKDLNEKDDKKKLLNKQVSIVSCGDDTIKVRYVLNGYNDCGCDSQEPAAGTGNISNRICKE